MTDKVLEALRNIPDDVFEKIAADIKREQECNERYMRKFRSLTKEQRHVFIRKVVDKYESDEYKDKEYSKGYMPRNTLYYYIFMYGETYGRAYKKGYNGIFPEDAYIIDGDIVIRRIYGQGSAYFVEFHTEQIEQINNPDSMNILKTMIVPTGEIYTAQGEKGRLLEFLTVGDYGKDANIKADFLGITRELNGVPNGQIQPLTEKWVVTLSTQYGCSMNCVFCDVPKVGKGINATYKDLLNQVELALKQHPEIHHTKRLNIHFARMGEPTWNFDVIFAALAFPNLVKPYIGNSLIHPVVSTMLPKNNKRLREFLLEWATTVKNIHYDGDAGLQFSINSTDDAQREYLFSGNSLSLEEISEIGKELPMPNGRKFALNFALADDTIIDGKRLRELFDPEKFMCKITPLHRTASCEENGIQTTGGYDTFTPYKDVEEDLKANGFDVIVFVPSYDEDNSLITCGNAILSGKLPTTDYKVILDMPDYDGPQL